MPDRSREADIFRVIAATDLEVEGIDGGHVYTSLGLSRGPYLQGSELPASRTRRCLRTRLKRPLSFCRSSQDTLLLEVYLAYKEWNWYPAKD